MARAYSLDLRKRVVAAVAGGQTCRTVAERFGKSWRNSVSAGVGLPLNLARNADPALT
jgi:transposase